MGYLHINNLYRPEAQRILLFKEVYALEKIHGTSAHISYNEGQIGFFSGGESYERFKGLFDEVDLLEKFHFMGQPKVIVYGEAYGGKQQGMSATYGKDLKFVAFDVRIGEYWLTVPNAAEVCSKLGIEFVAYNKVPATVEELDAERDLPSRQAIRNGINEFKVSEGIVIRPLEEFVDSNGERVIAKHKHPSFSERKSKADTIVDPEKKARYVEAQAIAEEWVTPMRLEHVLQKFVTLDMSHTREVINMMVEDVYREGKGEFTESKDVERAIGALTGKLLKQKLNQQIKDN